jgi:hypothetical protein
VDAMTVGEWCKVLAAHLEERIANDDLTDEDCELIEELYNQGNIVHDVDGAILSMPLETYKRLLAAVVSTRH